VDLDFNKTWEDFKSKVGDAVTAKEKEIKQVATDAGSDFFATTLGGLFGSTPPKVVTAKEAVKEVETTTGPSPAGMKINGVVIFVIVAILFFVMKISKKSGRP